MRNEKKVLNQINEFARYNDEIRAVILNGSRVNPKKPIDELSDYDVIYLITGETDFRNNQSWIGTFGELIIMQQDEFVNDGINSYIFMMQFSDGVRIDLTFFPAKAFKFQLNDSLKRKLLDKDNILGEFPEPDESVYLTRKPIKKEFDAVINEYLWVSLYVAKGLCRDQLCYVKHTHDVIVRGSLNKILEWYIGKLYNWNVNPGIYGKWFKNYLPAEIWKVIEKSYSGSDRDDIWKSLTETGVLVSKLGNELAKHLDYDYPQDVHDKVTRYLLEMKKTFDR